MLAGYPAPPYPYYPYYYDPLYYPYPYPYPYPYEVAARVATIAAYHDVIRRAEAVNAIADLVSPSADAALKILQGATSPGGKSFVQVESKSEGVPVLIEPKLLKNEAEDADLSQRDYIIDGINGIDFVQTEEASTPVDDTVTLYINGVPLTVYPESMLLHNT